jgi:hypothetical protein
LGDRQQFVKSGGAESSTRPVTCGVPQGSVLGSHLFHFFQFHMYADDSQIYHSASISDLQRCYEVNLDLQRIFDWMGADGLKVNPKKSQVILIHRSRAQIPEPELYIGFDPIRVVISVNILVFVLNENLTAVDHSERVCRIIYSILRSICPLASHTPFPVIKRLVQSLVTLHINYGNIVFSSVDVTSRGKIRVVFNAWLRYIQRVRPKDDISHLNSSG